MPEITPNFCKQTTLYKLSYTLAATLILPKLFEDKPILIGLPRGNNPQ